jgi:hypothetical protein
LVPWDEHEVSNGTFVTQKILLAFQSQIENIEDTNDLILVALDGTGQLLVVKSPEPGCLAKVRALSTDLESDPLLQVVFPGEGADTELVFLVIGIGKVLDDT